VAQVYKGAAKEGLVGVVKGIGRGLIGVPMKPLCGFFDFFGKSIEGILHSMGTTHTTQNRIHEPSPRGHELTYAQEQSIRHWLENIDETFSASFFVNIYTRRGRLRKRLLILTTASFHVINVGALAEMREQPKSVPLSLITEILVPLAPETTFAVCVSKVIHGRDSFKFVVPDRDTIINYFKTLIAEHPQGKMIKVRGVNKDY